MSEKIRIARERLAKSRRLTASQQQTTEMLLKKTAEQLKEERR